MQLMASRVTRVGGPRLLEQPFNDLVHAIATTKPRPNGQGAVQAAHLFVTAKCGNAAPEGGARPLARVGIGQRSTRLRLPEPREGFHV